MIRVRCLSFVLFSVVFLLATLYYANLQAKSNQKVVTNDGLTLSFSEHKVILAWTTVFHKPMDHGFYFSPCPNAPCRLTSDRRFADKAHALVFHGRKEDFNPNDLPSSRNSAQRFVFLSHENPMVGDSAIGLTPKNFFNWTMTYRLDSDVPWPYAYVIRRESERLKFTPALHEMWTEIVRNKSKLVVWMASNCYTISGREKYVAELQKFVDIDIIGDCGRKHRANGRWKTDEIMAGSCSRSKHKECEALIEGKYKFHIAFENTICKHYITEKYWGRWKLFSVPIVLKRSIYENLVPNNSFIAIDDFKTAKDLANHLHKLDKDVNLYLEYFAWRTQGYENVANKAGHALGFCRLCEMLWNQSEPRKSYEDLAQWWVKGSYCDTGNYIASFLR